MKGRVTIVVVLLLLAAALVARADRQESVPLRASFSAFPMQIGDWRGIQQPAFDEKILAILGVDDYLTRVYVSGGVGVDLYVGYWQSQRQGDTIHSPLNCLPGAGWEPLSKQRIVMPGSKDQTINRVIIQNGLDRQFVLYWYQSHGRVVASEYWSKFYLVSDAMRLNRTDGSIVRVITPIQGEGADAEARAEAAAMRFVRDMFPLLNDYLPS